MGHPHHSSQPRRLPAPPTLLQAVQHAHRGMGLPSPQPRYHVYPGSGYSPRGDSSPTGSKPYDTNSRYQPSRGAQRDAKWQARYAERVHLISKAASAHAGRPIPPIALSPQPGQGYHTRPAPPPAMGYPPKTGAGAAPPPPPALAHGHARYPPGVDRIRAEQQAAIAAARRAHMEGIMRERAQVEGERKTRRIQLQVYVHARPTTCLWKGCEAVLNSWALLEKHILLCHLQQPSRAEKQGGKEERVTCEWNSCLKNFATREETHHHALTGHMADFSARCPFNCLYEGPTFSDLMAHIGRRHPHATPDDFVPGLIHFKPTFLPAKGNLPPLPPTARITPIRTGSITPEAKPFAGEMSARTKKIAWKGIASGHRPRKDDFADKRGASAAISAIIENSRRIYLAYHAANPHPPHPEGDDLAAGSRIQDTPEPPVTATSVPMTATDAVAAGIPLLDIRHSAQTATEDADREVAESLQVEESSSDSFDSAPSSPRPWTRVKVKLPHRDRRTGGSEGDTVSEPGSIGDSEYDDREGAFTLFPMGRAEMLKRSERLKRKKQEGFAEEEKPGSIKIVKF